MPLTCRNRAVPAAPSEPPHTIAPELFLIFDGNRTGPGGRLSTVHSVRAQRSRAEDVHRSPVISQRSYVQPTIVIASPTIASASAISGRPHGWKNEVSRRAAPVRPRAPNPSRRNDQAPSSWPPRLGAAFSPRRTRSQSAAEPDPLIPWWSGQWQRSVAAHEASGGKRTEQRMQGVGWLCGTHCWTCLDLDCHEFRMRLQLHAFCELHTASSFPPLASCRQLSDSRCSAARRGSTAPGRHGHQTTSR
jgi:hypothetical protein